MPVCISFSSKQSIFHILCMSQPHITAIYCAVIILRKTFQSPFTTRMWNVGPYLFNSRVPKEPLSRDMTELTFTRLKLLVNQITYSSEQNASRNFRYHHITLTVLG